MMYSGAILEDCQTNSHKFTLWGGHITETKDTLNSCRLYSCFLCSFHMVETKPILKLAHYLTDLKPASSIHLHTLCSPHIVQYVAIYRYVPIFKKPRIKAPVKCNAM